MPLIALQPNMRRVRTPNQVSEASLATCIELMVPLTHMQSSLKYSTMSHFHINHDNWHCRTIPEYHATSHKTSILLPTIMALGQLNASTSTHHTASITTTEQCLLENSNYKDKVSGSISTCFSRPSKISARPLRVECDALYIIKM